MSLYKYFEKAQVVERDLEVSETRLSDDVDIDDDIDEVGSDYESRAKHPRVDTLHCRDIASCVGGGDIPDVDKYELLTNHFTPGIDYRFPKIANGRSFQPQWLRHWQYPWLAYSQQVNGGYCLPCVLFARCGYRGSEPGLLVQRPLTQFGKALELLRKHSEKEHHKLAVIRSDGFRHVFSGSQHSVQCQLDKTMAETVATNRNKLKSIVNTIILCGRQNFPLRGHHDSGTDVEQSHTSANHGNFWALLHFRVEAGDTVLEEHLATAAKNATYTSGDIQNQIISILGDHIRNQILQTVKQVPWFTIIADEVTDLANKEQLSLVVRYVHPDHGLIREDLLTFLECDTGVTGSCLAEKILGFLRDCNLDITKLRGQSYDGAGNMSGKTRGAAAIVTSQYPLALYLHCASHCLNLAVVKSLEVSSIRNMMGVLGRVYSYFDAHPKRQYILEKSIDDTQPGSKVHKLKDLCRTRWVQRLDALNLFLKLHPSIVACMENIYTDGTTLWSVDAVTDARTLHLAITTTDFLCSLVITNAGLQYIQALTSSLQAEAKDIVEAVGEIANVTAALKDVRKNLDMHHSQWFKDIEKLCQSVGIQPSIPRLCSRQRHRNNVPADSPSDYYRRTISTPLIDHLISELDSRFSSHHQEALQGMFLVPSVLITISAAECNDKLQHIAEFYDEDLPSPSTFQSELHCWHMKWQEQKTSLGESCLPLTPMAALRHATSMFPNIKVLLTILCTLPVTSCSSERSFSGLKRIKSSLRTTMGNTRLSGLALLNIHRDIPIDVSAIIDEFARRHPRRLQLSNIFSD